MRGDMPESRYGGVWMTQGIVEKWDEDLAIRVPFDVVRMSGLSVGEQVEIEANEGDILIRRPAANAPARLDAESAVAEIISESREHSFRDLSIGEVLSAGRRG